MMKPMLKTIVNLNSRLVRAFRTFFIDFCNNSNIHGLRYFTARSLHWSERLWWVIALGVSLWMCGSLIHDVWMKRHEKPVTMSFTEKEVHISEVPFPCVTLCPEIKTMKRKFNLSAVLESLSNLSYTQNARLNAMSHLCSQLPDFIEYTETFANNFIYKRIQDMALTTDDMLGMCDWYTQPTICSNSFVPILTDEGVCFSFNALNSKEIYTDEMAPGIMTVKNNPQVSNWSLEFGYKFDMGAGAKEYPIRMDDAGKMAALRAQFVVYEQNFEYNCRGFNQGFKIILTVPGEALRMSRNFFRVPLSADTLIKIKPKLITSSEGIRKYTPKQRQCFYSDERQLRFYKIYAQSSCEVECLANFTKMQCGCVKFSMPRDKNTKICGAASIKCYQLAEKKWAKSAESFYDECNCLPTCTSIEYHAEMDRSNFDARAIQKIVGESENPFALTTVSIFYKSHQMETIKRIELCSVIDFLAICGGLLGLCLGISLLSIVELVYYSTLRWFCITCHSKSSDGDIAPPVRERVTSSIVVRILRTLRSFFVEYCDNSNIHGLRYFTKRILHWSERLWWIISFGLSLWLCSSMIRNIWIQWKNNPVSMSFTETDVSNLIPFPTVTICPETKILNHKFNLSSPFMEFSELYETGPSMELVMTMHICTSIAEYYKDIAGYIDILDKHINESGYDVIENIAPSFDDVIYKCWWQNKICNCSKHIVPVFTDDGICFTFNALNSHEIYTDEMAPGMMITKNNPNVSEWSLEDGYKDEMSDREYPVRVMDSGKNSALDIALTLSERDFNYFCRGYDQGFRVTLSVPGEELKISHNSLRIPVSEDALIKIKPKLITTSEGLRSYTPSQRQCFYNSERKLRFYKIYSQSSCEMECLANYTRLKCGCVKFSMPRDRNTSICGMKSIICYKTAETKLSTNNHAESFRAKCNCLPACTSIEYHANIDHLKFDTVAINRIHGYETNDSSIQKTRLAIFFEGNQVETTTRMEAYKFTDFLAICGGLLGLFLGISALSIIELFYYITLRVFWTIRHSRFENMIE